MLVAFDRKNSYVIPFHVIFVLRRCFWQALTKCKEINLDRILFQHLRDFLWFSNVVTQFLVYAGCSDQPSRDNYIFIIDLKCIKHTNPSILTLTPRAYICVVLHRRTRDQPQIMLSVSLIYKLG